MATWVEMADDRAVLVAKQKKRGSFKDDKQQCI